jgi:ubiquinone/menaquinone biosynthesis C-methylase UbiE
VDPFHVGGADESAALARLAGFGTGQHVLDVGGGIGGGARLLASPLGCRVTVVDLTPEFCAAGEELTRRTGLADRVAFRCASALAMPFESESFDGAWTQHAR